MHISYSIKIVATHCRACLAIYITVNDIAIIHFMYSSCGCIFVASVIIIVFLKIGAIILSFHYSGNMDQKHMSVITTQTTLTHRGRVTHICVGKLTIIGSDNGLSPGRRQAIIWTNAGILLIGPLGTNFSEILSKIHTFSFKKMHFKTSSAKWRPFCFGLNVLRRLFDIQCSAYINHFLHARFISSLNITVTLTVLSPQRRDLEFSSALSGVFRQCPVLSSMWRLIRTGRVPNMLIPLPSVAGQPWWIMGTNWV